MYGWDMWWLLALGLLFVSIWLYRSWRENIRELERRKIQWWDNCVVCGEWTSFSLENPSCRYCERRKRAFHNQENPDWLSFTPGPSCDGVKMPKKPDLTDVEAYYRYKSKSRWWAP